MQNPRKMSRENSDCRAAAPAMMDNAEASTTPIADRPSATGRPLSPTDAAAAMASSASGTSNRSSSRLTPGRGQGTSDLNETMNAPQPDQGRGLG